MFTSIFKYLPIIFIAMYSVVEANCQTDTAKYIRRIASDTTQSSLNMDAAYNRPVFSVGKLPVAIGGYLEANTQYATTDGVSEGLSFQAKRFTIFLSSTIAPKIKFLSELEFEDGTKEINLEFAAMDVELHTLLNVRGGIIMNPIGAFNQNHDGPRWDFVDRPITATTLIPATLSNAGFGLHGKHFVHEWTLGYETYITNGFNDKIIDNAENRTSLAAGKSDPERFEENFSGVPMFTGKIAVRNRKIGEFGCSYMSGVYNKWRDDGVVLDKKRRAKVLAIDFNTSLLNDRVYVNAELAKIMVDIPDTYSQQYGSKQMGGYLDIVGTLLKRNLMNWRNARLNLGFRLEYADYNRGKFLETQGNIADDLWAIVPVLAFRPVGNTVIRFNYRHQQQRDLLGNPASKTGAVQLGFSTYF